MEDASRKGRIAIPNTKGERNPRAKLTAADVVHVRQMIADGRNNTEIAEDFPVGHASISRIRLGKSWLVDR